MLGFRKSDQVSLWIYSYKACAIVKNYAKISFRKVKADKSVIKVFNLVKQHIDTLNENCMQEMDLKTRNAKFFDSQVDGDEMK